MSKTTKRKHVFNEVLKDDMSLPTENQKIVKILSSRGNNLHEVEAPDQTSFLVSMPTKFRKNVWVKRGNYVLVEPIEEGDKVKAEIVKILTSEHVKWFRKDNVWPVEFDEAQNDKRQAGSDDDDDELFVNTNRLQIRDCSASDNTSDSDADTAHGKECIHK